MVPAAPSGHSLGILATAKKSSRDELHLKRNHVIVEPKPLVTFAAFCSNVFASFCFVGRGGRHVHVVETLTASAQTELRPATR